LVSPLLEPRRTPAVGLVLFWGFQLHSLVLSFFLPSPFALSYTLASFLLRYCLYEMLKIGGWLRAKAPTSTKSLDTVDELAQSECDSKMLINCH